MKTAQILIIGDEILSGRTQDTNTQFLARGLFVRGVRVIRVEVIPDNFILVSEWIRKNHGLSDFLFVSGGIGGTPDDITREAVAQGMGTTVERNPTAEKILKEYYKDKVNEDRMRMADLPRGCTLIENKVTLAPGFKIKNVYVFAGVPKILQAMFEAVADEFSGAPLFEEELNLQVGEGEVATFMRTINKEFPLLELGSYPTFDASKGYKTQLVFRAEDKNLIAKALARFKELAVAVLK